MFSKVVSESIRVFLSSTCGMALGKVCEGLVGCTRLLNIFLILCRRCTGVLERSPGIKLPRVGRRFFCIICSGASMDFGLRVF